MPQDPAQSNPGTFVWHEVGTHDVAATREFYTKLLGWTAGTMDLGPGHPYTMFSKGGVPVAGAFLLHAGQATGTQPHWLTYIEVDDVDAAFQRAYKLKAYCLVPPTDIPGVGRHAILKDPTGAAFAIFSSAPAAPAKSAPKAKAPKAKPAPKAKAKPAAKAKAKPAAKAKAKPAAKVKAKAKPAAKAKARKKTVRRKATTRGRVRR